MTRYRIDIAYDGSDYGGWQIQPNAPSIQEELQKAIKKVTGEKVIVHGSGRTDRGVHARMQVAHFDFKKKRAAGSLLISLNAVLPWQIRVNRIRQVPSSFHARRSVVSKEYRYFIWNDAVVSPFKKGHVTRVRKKLNIALMKKAASLLVGRKDFSSFIANPKYDLNTTVRSLTGLSVTQKGREIVITAVGEGFMYKMVRSLAGFLIRVGEGAIAPEKVLKILSSRKRTAQVPTAPAEGLFLWRVRY